MYSEGGGQFELQGVRKVNGGGYDLLKRGYSRTNITFCTAAPTYPIFPVIEADRSFCVRAFEGCFSVALFVYYPK